MYGMRMLMVGNRGQRQQVLLQVAARIKLQKSVQIVACLNSVEYLVEGLGNDSTLCVASTAIHSVCLASPCLPVGKDCAIVPFQHTVHNWFGCLVVHGCLRAVPIKDVVESKGLWQFPCLTRRLHHNLESDVTSVAGICH